MNLSTIIGNLGADAEVVSSNGKQFISLSIADSRKYTTQDGREVNETNWVDAIISNADHPVLPYLKQGVKVCVVGNCSLRVYSSKKDRMMKAGQTIHVQSIELCGGQSESVPRQLIDPATGGLVDTQKYYWCNFDTKPLKKDETYGLIDARGNQYVVNKQGFVAPVQPPKEESAEQAQSENQEQNQ